MDKPKQTRKKSATKSQTQPETTPVDFHEVGGSPVPGLTLRSILPGHSQSINWIAWSPDGQYLAEASDDGTVSIWDVARGERQTVLEGHEEPVTGISWSPDGKKLASGSSYNTEETIFIWDLVARRSVAVLRNSIKPSTGSKKKFNTLAWSPDGEILASRGADEIICYWNPASGSLITKDRLSDYVSNGLSWSPDGEFLAVGSYRAINIRERNRRKEPQLLSGEILTVYSTAWSPSGRIIAAGGSGGPVIWDAQTLKQTHVLEGHTESIHSISFESSGALFASRATDGTVRLWRTDTWEPVAVFGETSPNRAFGLAFHPHQPLLATLGEVDTIIRVWDLDLSVLLSGQAAVESVRYTTAKLVLVGDSGVGKTGLGWRLAHGEFKEHPSTHGQQFWVVDELRNRRKDGTECEAVLWDLAGQPVYRPVHAIFLDDVDVALVLFDPTNRTEPLKGAQFWLGHLADKGKLPPTVLIGGRVDRGAAAVSREELEQFCQRYGISGSYIGTSAKSGEGLDELLATIKAQIPWEQMTTTVTTVTFKRIKEYVLALKERPDRKGVLVRPEELRAQLEAKDAEWEFTDAEMMTAVKHLATHGYVAVLRGSSGGEFILLTPELLVDLASSIVLQADKHPRDLGALSETELLRGVYNLPELATLERGEQQILLDAAVARFLSHNICFREVLGADTLLIFPGLIKQKRPLFDGVETTEDVSYIVSGRVENVYAALVVLLGYTQTFTRVNQWQSQAQYQMGEGQLCGFRLIEEREGEIELVLYYSAAMPAYGHTVFQGLFEQFLYQRDVQVTRFPPVVCANGHRQERSTVVKRIREGKKFLFCEECGERIPLPELEKPLALGVRDSRLVQRAKALAHLRSAYETHLVRVKGFRRDRTPPRCFVSHAPEQAAWATQITRDLGEAGVFVAQDRAQIQESDFVILVGTPAYRGAWERSAEPIAADAALVSARLRQVSVSWPTVIPLLLEGDADASLPRELRGSQAGDFRDETRHAVNLFDLVLTLYAVPLNHPAFKPLRDSLLGQWANSFGTLPEPERVASMWQGVAPKVTPAAEVGKEVFISYAWGGESEKVADELDGAFRDRGVSIVRDKRDLGFKGSIRKFMEDIGRGRCVILVISDKYLKSPNCLFELVQVARSEDFAGRVFPVVLGDARIYDPVERAGYVKYWERKRDELDAAMKQLSSEHLQGFREDIDLYAEIRTLLPRLTDILKDMNTLTPEMHRGSDFEELFEAVMSKLGA